MTALESSLVRLRLDVAYDGTDFSGWASQPGLRTVQGTLEAAIATVLRLPSASLTVAGRTDAGVHARGQVCHLDLSSTAAPECDFLRRRLSRLLPDDVRVREVSVAPPGFDARFSASWRRYAYRLCDDPSRADPLSRHATVVWAKPLDVAAMNLAAGELVGEHDFAAFCKPRAGATTIRTLLELECVRAGDVVTAHVQADAFCHHMVRALTGAMVAVGDGRAPVGWPGEVLREGVRDSRVTVLPARGLTLEEVGYPPAAQLADRARTARAVRTSA